MKLGKLLDHTRRAHIGTWKTGMFLCLSVLAGVNLFILPGEAEYGADAYPGFWAMFGLTTSVAMVWVMKKIVQPLIERPGESDDD